MRFVLVLHAHLPYVLNHGRWPHGSDWICEAALDTYLPLVEQLRALRRDGVPAPITLGITPILAQQLAHPTFAAEFRAFVAQRLAACDDAGRDLPAGPDAHLVPVAAWWKARWTRLAALFDALDGDLLREVRAHVEGGRLELLSSAATHGFLPLLARDESIRLQLAVGRAEHARLFGRPAEGAWLPECAYRPAGPWAPWPTAPGVRHRAGIESFLAEAGYRHTVVDAHLVRAGRPLGLYAHAPASPWARDADARVRDDADARSPYRDWRIGHHARRRAVRALVRDPRSSFQIWSREGGYPGDGHYLEFHKIRYPGGLKLWRVTGTRVDLGAKAPYDPGVAATRAQEHARHFADVLAGVVARERDRPGHAVIVAPFDAELFGHWWAEGVDFLGALYRALAAQDAVVPLTAAAHGIASGDDATAIDLPGGSWGKDGDWTMWLSPLVAWTWERLWPLEARFWDVAPRALDGDGDALAVLAQAARELLLAQSSDWQFIISTGEVADYAIERFTFHADACDRLLAALDAGEAGRVAGDAAALRAQDDVFPGVLDQVRAVVARRAG
jgi:1,4-alpha-glucan branching enzyme